MDVPKPLTPKQERFLRLLVGFIEKNEVPPTVREAQKVAGFASTRSAIQYLDALEEAGYIARGEGPRNLRILVDPWEARPPRKAGSPRGRKSLPAPHPGSLLLVDASDLDAWADRLDARAMLPQLVRRLIHATTDRPVRIAFGAGEAVQLGGWDGTTVIEARSAFVPAGVTGWELGAGRDIKGKAEADYQKRTKEPGEFPCAEMTFIFVTPRRWPDRHKWTESKRRERVWKDVRAYDADDLEQWLELAPGVHAWLSARLGKKPEGATDLGSYWTDWAGATSPALTPEFLLAGRQGALDAVRTWLTSESSPLVLQAETPDEAVAVLAAVLRRLPEAEQHELRAVVTLTSSAWQQLEISREPLILIPLFDLRSITLAVRNGHHVLVPLGRGDSRSPRAVPVPPIDAVPAEKVLLEMGVTENRARDLARLAHRSTTAFRRHIAVTPELQQPGWAEPNAARALVPALLAGKWDETKEGDRTALGLLSGMSYEALAEHLVRWSNETDAPVRHIGSTWFIVSKEDSWPLLSRFLTRDDLRRFDDVAMRVLGTQDPRYELPLEKQWMANILGHPSPHSYSLREGLADTLALFGAKGEVTRATAGEPARAIATAVVRRLMDKANANTYLWASLAHVLPLLAEAAPESFLTGVEAGLAGDEPVLRGIFTDSKSTSSFTTTSPHPSLLWALERIAWAPEHLGRAATALAKLAQIDPGGTLGNRPIGSLREIFLFWHPQTHATLDERLAVINTLRRIAPAAAWHLMTALLPKGHDMAMNHTPAAWRDWGGSSPTATHGEYARGVHEIVQGMLNDVGVSAERWSDLIEQVSKISEADAELVLDTLSGIDVTTFPPQARIDLWHSLRQLISLHRSHRDASWSVDDATIDRLAEQYERFAPTGLWERYRWLFTGHPKLVEGREGDWDEHQLAVARYRADAVREIYREGGLVYLLQFARTVESPNEVGIALSTIGDADALAEEILGASLASPEPHESRFGRGFVWESIRRRGRAWAEGVLQNAGSAWRPEQRAELLVCLPYEESTWQLATNFGDDTDRAYWRRVIAFAIPDTHVEFGARKLLKYGRPFAVVDYLAAKAHSKTKSLPPELVADALHAVMEATSSNDDPVDSSFAHDIGELLDALAADPGELPLARVAALEWAFVPILTHVRTPRVLHDELRRDPMFFAELITMVYRPNRDDDEERAAVLTDEEQAKALAAHELLESWRSVPGTAADGTIDRIALESWTRTARDELRKRDRSEIGDFIFGQVLSGTPRGDDGIWPHPCVRDLIENADSADIERGIATGVYNSRGVVSRSLTEGGTQERQLVERYRGYAEATQNRWHRTTAMLRQIADWYEDAAARADQDVELRANLER